MTRRHNQEGTFSFRKDGLVAGRVMIEGRRYSVYAKSRKAAKEKLADLVNLHSRQLIKERHLTYGDWLSRWMSELKADLKPKTKKSYEQMIKLHIRPALGSIKLVDLTAQHIRQVLASKNTLSGRTIQYIRAIIKASLSDAMSLELIDRNVASLVKIASPVRDIPTPWSISQIKEFFTHAEGHRLEALFTTAIFTGCRQGELLALEWSDVDLESGKLIINKTLNTIDGVHIISSPKSAASTRQVFLSQQAVKKLAEHRSRQWEERLASPRWDEQYDLVFASHSGTHLDPGNVRRILSNIRVEAGLPKQRFHDLRHSCANLLAASGASLLEASRWLGHSQISITADLYSHVFDESLRKASDNMGDLLSA